MAAELSDATCRVPGVTMQWELDHCFLGSGTDDEEHPLVRACLNLAPSHKESLDCKRNILLKRYRCLYLIQKQIFKDDVEKCLDSPLTIGTTVKSGGVGSR